MWSAVESFYCAHIDRTMFLNERGKLISKFKKDVSKLIFTRKFKSGARSGGQRGFELLAESLS